VISHLAEYVDAGIVGQAIIPPRTRLSIDESELYKQFFIGSNKTDHHMFDLPAFVKFKLEKENINIIRHINEDTYIMKDKYPSYRRSTHTDEIYEQHILSAIMIK